MGITGSFSTKNKKSSEKKTGVRVIDIIYDRIMERINSNKKLPWNKGFSVMCINWATGKEYEGINQFLLMGGEYITLKQLNAYNEKVATDIIKEYKKKGIAADSEEVKIAINNERYKVKKGSKAEIVVFFTTNKTLISDEKVKEYKLEEKAIEGYSSSEYLKEAYVNNIHFALIDTEKGAKWHKINWVLRYYNVFNINVCENAVGRSLRPKLGRELIYTYDKADSIVEKYVKKAGIKIKFESCKNAYYSDREDAVTLPDRQYFDTDEGYYRTLFHELAHSTGIASRLNRPEFIKYHNSKEERSKEEVIAETTAMLLAQDCGFNDNDERNNSDTYIQSWLFWIKNNKEDFIYGLMAANKARNYIKGNVKKGKENIIC